MDCWWASGPRRRLVGPRAASAVGAEGGTGYGVRVQGYQVVALTIAVLITVIGLTWFTRGVIAIVATLRRGRPAPERTTEPGRRTWLTLAEVLGHRRFARRPAIRAAHWVVMLSFPALVLTLVSGYGQIVDPWFVLPWIGHWYPYQWTVEVFAWAGLAGMLALVVVRQRRKPRDAGDRGSRFFGSNAAQAYVVEGVILAVTAAVLGLRALEYALHVDEGPGFGWWTALGDTDPVVHLAPRGAFDADFPLTAWLGAPLSHLSVGTLEVAVVVLATVKIVVSMAWMIVVGRRPGMGVAWHRFLAVVNVWARRELDGGPALGAAAPLRDAAGLPLDLTELEDLPEDLVLGAGRVEDLTWKNLLDVSTCTECGRCQEVCPAWATGKALSPKLMITALRDHAFATTPGLGLGGNQPTAPAGLTSATGVVPLVGSLGHAGLDVLGLAAAGGAGTGTSTGPSTGAGAAAALVGDVVTAEALWDCTTCGACVEACPVDIEHVDLFLDLRRHQVLAQGEAPAEIGQMLTKVERRGNPWGLAPRGRMAWTEGLDFPVPVIGDDVPDASAVDCLFWVGCAGAYDDHGKRTARAVAELLHVAGVSFAVLGLRETCSGDPARRAGNEALFQQLAHQAIDTLNEVKARRIVVTCAHCFNTIANEYPALGGHYSVLHHTELLETLVAEGRLRPVRRDSRTITYHDACYLGRHNKVYSPPRALLGVSGAEVTEMPRSGERSFCCGGGGARAFAEETVGRRIADERMAEAAATGADVVATACGFCAVMLTGARGTDGPEVRDVAEVLLDSVRPGEEPVAVEG